MFFNSSILRNYILINEIKYSTKNNDSIDSDKRLEPKQQFPYEFDLFVLSSTLIETITHSFIKNMFYKDIYDLQIINDLISFVFVSFSFEIIFDFFHYINHFIIHKNAYLYKNIHKIHHKFKYPNSITTFYQHPLDILFTNSIPMILSIYFMPIKPTYFQYILILTYKTFIEISGHTGKIIKSTSFPQFIWLPRILGIQLSVEDHDLHHSLNNCNYSKRFSLWDKFFGTYLKKN
jgi:sterol desaturase/sphingolipid hydroxylase (fatty acid hydroxylase superfamily)